MNLINPVKNQNDFFIIIYSNGTNQRFLLISGRNANTL